MKPVSILLILSMFFSACSSVITEIPVRENEYIDITNAEVLFVTTTDGITHEVTNFQFTDDKLVGEEKAGVLKKRLFVADLSEISFLKIMGARDSRGNIITEKEFEENRNPYGRLTYTFGGFLVSLPVGFLAGILAAGISLLIVPDKSAHGYGALGRLFYIGIPAGVLVIVTESIISFKRGKRRDEKKAIQKIEEQRYGSDSGEKDKSGEMIKK